MGVYSLKLQSVNKYKTISGLMEGSNYVWRSSYLLKCIFKVHCEMEISRHASMPFRYRENSKTRHVICLTVLYSTGKTIIRSKILKKAEGRVTAQGSWSRLLSCTQMFVSFRNFIHWQFHFSFFQLSNSAFLVFPQ